MPEKQGFCTMTYRWKPSVTVAGIIEKDGRYLLVEEHTPKGLMFNNPAGHLDPGESPLEACVREVLEETAYAFTPTALVGIYLSRFGKTRKRTSRICASLSPVYWVSTTLSAHWMTALCVPCGWASTKC
jgi:8-oxo-dGTP pyrophosphatase MutT (NUDIX family)